MTPATVEFPPSLKDYEAEVRRQQRWRTDALCQHLPPDIFYSPEHEETARRVCHSCPVRIPCLEFALLTKEPDGIWGGLDLKERLRLWRRLRIRAEWSPTTWSLYRARLAASGAS